MTVLYVAPNVNHHQIPIVKEIIRSVGRDNFRYFTPMLTEKSRQLMGWSFEREKWLLELNKDNYHQFEFFFLNWDVVLCSIRDYYPLMNRRLQNNKLTFYFTERWFKTGIDEINLHIRGVAKLRLLHPKFIKVVKGFRGLNRFSNFFFLAQGAFAANDFRFLGLCKNRIYNWGYFTETESTNSSNVLPEGKINVLCCGRLLKWKKVGLLVRAFKALQEKRSNVHLTIIGEGPEKDSLVKLSERILKPHSYSFYNFMPVRKVRSLMQEADIYVIPSNGYEGWGAVVNEAMAESCAVIGSNKVGAIKTLVDHGINGFVFKDGSVRSLSEILLQITQDGYSLEKIKEQSRKHINELWSPRIAAKRFIAFCDSKLINSELPHYERGVMKEIG